MTVERVSRSITSVEKLIRKSAVCISDFGILAAGLRTDAVCSFRLHRKSIKIDSFLLLCMMKVSRFGLTARCCRFVSRLL